MYNLRNYKIDVWMKLRDIELNNIYEIVEK